MSILPSEGVAPGPIGAGSGSLPAASAGVSTLEALARSWSLGLGPLTGAGGPPTRFPCGFAHFLIEGLIGEGGNGRVYRAIQMEGIHRTVALKLPHEDRDGVATERFRNEAQHLGEHRDRNIVSVYEFGIDPDSHYPYLSMELIGDGSLSAIIAARRRAVAGQPAESDPAVAGLPARAYFRRMAELVRDVARALGKCHRERRLIHRDLKPSNILTEWQPTLRPLLTDFGLARLLPEDSAADRDGLLGTYEYMPPERLAAAEQRGAAVDGFRADVYGLGAVLFEAIGLRPPRPRGDRGSDPRAWARIEVPRARQVAPSLPSDLGAILDKAMDEVPARRYPDADRLADDLDRWLDGREVSARPRGRWRRVGDRLARRPLVLVAAAAILLILAGIAVGLLVAEARHQARVEGLKREIRAALMRGSVLEATDLFDQLRRLAPDDPQAPELLGASLRAFLLEGRAISTRGLVDRGVRLGDSLEGLPLPQTERAALGAELEAMLGVGDLLVITHPPEEPVRIYQVDAVGRPLLTKIYREVAGGPSTHPGRVKGLPGGDYWIVAGVPGDERWVERGYRHIPTPPGGFGERRVFLPLRTNAEATGGPVGMHRFDGGTFLMGIDPEPNAPSSALRSSPRHTRLVPPFWLDRHEVTNEQILDYAREAGDEADLLAARIRAGPGRTSPDWPRLPVVGLTIEQMSDYACWRGLRLPTEAELEYAAATLAPDLRALRESLEKDARHRLPHPAGSFPADRLGTQDGTVSGLFSNVAEATQLRFFFYPGYVGDRSALAGRVYDSTHVVRCGNLFGSEASGAELARPLGHQQRAFLLEGATSPSVGFRCARSNLPVDGGGMLP